MLKHLVDLLNFWSRASTRYNLIRMDEEKRDKSVRLAADAILFCILGVVLVALSSVGFVLLWKHFTSIDITNGVYEFPILTVFGLLLVIGTAIFSFLQTVIYSLILIIYQFKLNKRGARWAALVIWFLSIGGMIASAVLAVGLFW